MGDKLLVHYLFKKVMACGANENLDLFLVNRGQQHGQPDGKYNPFQFTGCCYSFSDSVFFCASVALPNQQLIEV